MARPLPCRGVHVQTERYCPDWGGLATLGRLPSSVCALRELPDTPLLRVFLKARSRAQIFLASLARHASASYVCASVPASAHVRAAAEQGPAHQHSEAPLSLRFRARPMVFDNFHPIGACDLSRHSTGRPHQFVSCGCAAFVQVFPALPCYPFPPTTRKSLRRCRSVPLQRTPVPCQCPPMMTSHRLHL